MPSAIVIVKNPGNDNWEGLGDHEFRVMPCKGERIDFNDPDGIGYSYEVVAVHHPLNPASTAGDVYAVRIGTVTDTVVRLFEESLDAR